MSWTGKPLLSDHCQSCSVDGDKPQVVGRWQLENVVKDAPSPKCAEEPK